jgi:hypothetical protein
VPLAPGKSHLVPWFTDALSDDFARICGFEDAEMHQHTYRAADLLDEVSHLDESLTSGGLTTD